MDANFRAESQEAARRALVQLKILRPTMSPEHAFSLAQLSLKAAAEEYFKPETERDGVLRSMVAVQEYFEARGIAGRDLAPLVRIINALCERESGIADPIFKPEPRNGRPRDSNAKQMKAGIIAALSEEYLNQTVSSGISKSQRLKALVRIFEKEDYCKITPANIATFTKDAKEGGVRDSVTFHFLSVKGDIERHRIILQSAGNFDPLAGFYSYLGFLVNLGNREITGDLGK